MENKKRLTVRILVSIVLLALTVGTVVASQEVPPDAPLTNEDIISLAVAGVSEEAIRVLIETRANRFDTSPGALIGLKSKGVGNATIEAMLKGPVSTPSRPKDHPAPGDLPSTYGYYLVTSGMVQGLLPSDVVTVIGIQPLGPGSGQSGFAVDGLAGEAPTVTANTTPEFIVYQQGFKTGDLHLSKLQHQESMKAYEFNMLGTNQAFFNGIYGRGYYDRVPVGLWRTTGDVHLRVQPVEGRLDMFRFLPERSLEPGNYALFLAGQLHDLGKIFGAAPGRKASAFYLAVSVSPPAQNAQVGVANAAARINGQELSSNEVKWLRFAKDKVLPQLAGDLSKQVRTAADVAWWGLKEGTFALDQPHSFSNCSTLDPDGHARDTRLGLLGMCDVGRPWQVGLAGVQVTNFDDQAVLETVKTIWPEKPSDVVLGEVTSLVELESNSAEAIGIRESSGILRRSWLLRHPVVGFTMAHRDVYHQCIEGAQICQESTQCQKSFSCEDGRCFGAWCFGSGWDSSRRFAATREAANRSIEDLIRYFSDKNSGVMAPTVTASSGPVGTYHRPGVNGDVLLLRADGTFSAKFKGKNDAGTYELVGEQLHFRIKRGLLRVPLEATLNGKTLVTEQGYMWERVSE
jgi:hypothetical protein